MADFKTRWQTAYDQQAPPASLPGGIRQFNGYRHPRLYAMLQESLQRATAHWNGLTILDAGCGTGDTNGFLKGRNQVVGVDFSVQMARYAQQNYGRVGVADVEQLPFATSSFDALIATGVWQCLRPETPFLTEVRRVLRPGGEVVLGWVLNRDYLLYRRGVHFRLDPSVQLSLLTVQEIKSLLQLAGLAVVGLYAALFPLAVVTGGARWQRPFVPAYTVRAATIPQQEDVK